MSARRGPAHQGRRAELAAVAYAQMAERGLEGLRVRDVATQAGINHATLIYYFPTKADLVAEVVGHVLEMLVTPVVTPVPGPDQPALRRLDHELADIAARLRGQPELFRVLTEVQLRAARDPRVAVALAHLDQAWHAYLAGLVRSGVDSGELRRGLDPDQAAIVLSVLFRGLGLRALQPEDAGPPLLVGSVAEMLARWLSA